ncbi:MAG: MFS transporter [Chloroflexi bacterium]|nr:MFS transporter [Chloroflexota bacterium]
MRTQPADQAPPQPGARALFAHRDFSYLWIGGVATSVAMSLKTLITAQWLYDTTGSAAQLGLLGLVQLLQIPLTLYGGTLADVIDRKKLMVFTQGMAFLMFLGLTVLAGTDQLAPWHIFFVTGVSGIVNTLGGSARPAMLPRVVPRELLTHAVTIQIITRQIAGIGAPLIFWQAYEVLGVTNSLAIGAVIALFATAAPVLIRASGKPDPSTSRRNTVSSLKEGFRFVLGHRLLPGLYLLDIGVVVVSFYRPLFPVFADQLYGMGAAGTGMLNAADAAGGIIGTSLVLLTNRVGQKGVIVLAGTLVYAAFLFAFGLLHVFWLGLVIVAVLGVTDSISMTMRQAIVQLTTPDKLLGRASSAHSFAAMGANNLGQIEVGLLSGAIGAGNTMVLGGFLAVIVTLGIWYAIPGIRRYRYDPSNPYEKHE